MGVAEERKRNFNALGYEVRYFAHRHKLTLEVAETMVKCIGPDRAKLDEAARDLKRAEIEV